MTVDDDESVIVDARLRVTADDEVGVLISGKLLCNARYDKLVIF